MQIVFINPRTHPPSEVTFFTQRPKSKIVFGIETTRYVQVPFYVVAKQTLKLVDVLKRILRIDLSNFGIPRTIKKIKTKKI
jgi:hypothetical protein